jgi:GTPase
VLRTLQAIEESDVCFFLMDVNEYNTQLDQRLAGIIEEAGKGLVMVVSKWDDALKLSQEAAAKAEAKKLEEPEQKVLTKQEKKARFKSMKDGSLDASNRDPFTRDAIAASIGRTFDFIPWAPLIFTSSVTGQNVTKLFDLALEIDERRHQEIKTRKLNDMLQTIVAKHPPAGLKNSWPKLRYIVQTDIAPPWFVIHGSNLKFIHWSYKRYIERSLREEFDFTGTPIKFSFRDEKQIKDNKARVAAGKDAKDFKGNKKALKHEADSRTR